ncbi:Uncharacterized protein SCF082_LOCUS10017 [Durusdinium trenchii]|uniref:Uncharacterized protein n=1 Tax=Durusdinium trenchii TaxID=1381693 RepID=A0ABP0J349_9DINO
MEQHPFLKKGGNERRRLETPVPEAEDDFFDNERHLVGVFDFDYDEIEDFETKVAWVSLLSIPCIWPLSLACCGPCFLQQNVEWRTRAQHVALTEDGIKYVTDREPELRPKSHDRGSLVRVSPVRWFMAKRC